MPEINKVVTDWTGWVGGPGASTMYFQGPDAPPAATINAFFVAIRGLIPSSIYMRPRNSGPIMSDVTGLPTGSWTTALQAGAQGLASGSYAAPAGAVVEWKTGVWANGHQIKGRTFLVPCAVSQYDSDGTLVPAAVTAVNAACTALLAAVPKLVVYSKTHATSPFAISGQVLDKVAVLRSRRP